MLFNFIEAGTLLSKRFTKSFQFLCFTLFHVLKTEESKPRHTKHTSKTFQKWGVGEEGRTISSAAFSLLLNVSLDAAPPALVPPTAPTKSEIYSINDV